MLEAGEATVKRTCRWCGEEFRARRGEGKRRGCPACEPPLVERAETVKPRRAGTLPALEQRAPSPT